MDEQHDHVPDPSLALRHMADQQTLEADVAALEKAHIFPKNAGWS
jgi:hypothetical protein